MSLAAKLLSASGVSAAVDTLYVDDAFSSFVYTGNGSTQTITNGIDLAGKGGLVWIKGRGGSTHQLFDTGRGDNFVLDTSSTWQSNSGWADYFDFNADGFGIPTTWESTNLANGSFVSWTFAKAAKFFDIVTYTGTGANRTISHNLGIAPGMIMVKRTDTTGSWMVYHNSIANTENLVLNTTAAKATNATAWNSTTATASVFSLGTHADVNTNGGTYIAYLFAHDTSADGIVQCGSFTTDGSAVSGLVNLGWEPQYILLKRVDAVGSWNVADTARRLDYGHPDTAINGSTAAKYVYLTPNSSTSETGPANYLGISQLGFTDGGSYAASGTFVYLAIRRPNKPPPLGTQVYNAIARTGTGAAATVTGVGFAPDLVALHSRSGTTGGRWEDRLRGATQELVAETTAAEAAVAQSVISFGMDGISLGTDGDWNTNAATYINHFFKRAPGVFDIVAYTGTGVAHTEAHGLGVVPELMIVKGRSAASRYWIVKHKDFSAANIILLNNTDAQTDSASAFNSTSPTATVFTLATSPQTNSNTETYVAYLFATKSGISKVGSYTGNGSSQTINCGFTTGSRFILIKRTNSTGDWFVFDTVRGIVAGNDPHLSLNTTAAEVTTDDSIDPDSTGFIVNQVAATNINVTSATYIFLSFA